MMVRLLAWNIRASQTAAQIAHLSAQKNADVLVLTEYRQLVRDDRLSAALTEAGWIYQHTPVKVPKVRGVLIASRQPLQPVPTNAIFRFGALTAGLSPCIACVKLPEYNTTLIGVYMPYADGPAKDTLWASLNQYARANASERYIITGLCKSPVIKQLNQLEPFGRLSPHTRLPEHYLTTLINLLRPRDDIENADMLVAALIQVRTWASPRYHGLTAALIEALIYSGRLEKAKQLAGTLSELRLGRHNDDFDIFVRRSGAKDLSERPFSSDLLVIAAVIIGQGPELPYSVT